jgi:PncC family amidohydrolase
MNKNIGIEIGQLLLSKGMTLSTAESCTGGLIGHIITSVSGSSAYYKGGVISYSNDIKRDVLGVQESALATYGAVSEVVVRQMASGVRRLMQTECAVATSGVAGPTGGTADKPVGTVWIAVAVGEVVKAKCLHLNGNRESNIREGTESVLEMLREEICG